MDHLKKLQKTMNKLNNQVISLLKIWYLDSMINVKPKHFIESFIEYAIYYWFFYTILNSNYLSLVAIVVVNYIKYISKNISINNQKLITGEFDLYLLLPINILIVTSAYQLSIIDAVFSTLLVLILVVIYVNYFLITISILVLISALYLISRSLLVLNNKYQMLDKLSLLVVLVVFSILYRPLMTYNLNLWFQIVILSFSLFVFYLSISLWRKVIQKYIRQ